MAYKVAKGGYRLPNAATLQSTALCIFTVVSLMFQAAIGSSCNVLTVASRQNWICSNSCRYCMQFPSSEKKKSRVAVRKFTTPQIVQH
ncbi:hypothetical protein M3J09_005049 [Ascochyta lentis]